MNRDLLEEKAVEYALGVLPREDAIGFESVLKQDRGLQEIVHEYQRINELDAREAPEQELSFGHFSKVMEQINLESERVDEGESVVGDLAERKVVPFLAWSGWAAAAACLALMFGLSGGLREGVQANLASDDIMLSDLGAPGRARLHVAQEELVLETRMMELADLAETYWYSQGLPPESVEGGSEAPTGGFTIFDSKNKIGFLGVENLPAGKHGKAYHLWAQTQNESAPLRAGILRGSETSRGLFFIDLTQNGAFEDFRGDVSFFVTEESEELPSAPSGNVVLSGI